MMLVSVLLVLLFMPAGVYLLLWVTFILGYHLGWYSFAEHLHRLGINWLRVGKYKGKYLAAAQDNMAVLLNAQGKYSSAEPFYLASLDIYRANLDTFDGSVYWLQAMLLCAEDYASMLCMVNRLSDARAVLEEASTTAYRLGFHDHAYRLTDLYRSLKPSPNNNSY